MQPIGRIDNRRCVALLIQFFLIGQSDAFQISSNTRLQQQLQSQQQQRMKSTTTTTSLYSEKRAGTFFNPVPEDNNRNENTSAAPGGGDDDITPSVPQPIVRGRKTGIGFGAPSQQEYTPKNQKPFVGIGPPLNDVTKPEYDEQGYTLYADERTGTKSRVFEALVDYPCTFTMKIVGDGSTNPQLFIEDILSIVAESCEIDYTATTATTSITEIIQHSTRTNGKWTSITVEAPVKSATMLYQLYENVDRDPRVKFKF